MEKEEFIRQILILGDELYKCNNIIEEKRIINEVEMIYNQHIKQNKLF